MRALASIYSHRVLGFMKTQVGFDPIQKRNPNPKRKVKNAPVGRPAGRPTHATVDRVGRPGPTETKTLLVGRPGGRSASSTGRLGGRPRAQIWPAPMRRFSLLDSDLYANLKSPRG